MSELITIEQLPVITQRLEDLAEELDQQIADALSMICTNDTIKYVRAMRADLNNKKDELENQRKTVKATIMKPYEDFAAIYKRCITDRFAIADKELKKKIDDVESGIKQMKEKEVRDYFDEYMQDFPQIDFLPFERLGLNITLSASTAALKHQVEDFVNKVADDMAMIATMDNRAEILLDYIPTLNAAQAVTNVTARHKAIEQIRKEQERMEPVPIAEPEPVATPMPIAKPEPVAMPEPPAFEPEPLPTFEPPVFEEPAPTFELPDFEPDPQTFPADEQMPGQIGTIRLTITDSIEKIDRLIAFLNEGGYTYHE